VKRLTYILAATLACTVLASGVEAADAPIVREIFTCTFNDGKDLDDLMDARDFYLKQMEKGGQNPGTSFVWTPFKAAVNFDFLWANNFADLATYARESDTYNNSAEGQAADARFASVATCTSSLAMRRTVYQAEGELTGQPGRPAILHAAACDYRHGSTPEDLDDLIGHIATVRGSTGLKDGSAGYASIPGVGTGPNSRDVYFYSVHASLENWAAANQAMQSAPGMPSLARHFAKILDCSTALFFGRQVVPAN